MEITCHNCGKSVSADTPKCVFCGAVIVVAEYINLDEQEQNKVIVPNELSLEDIGGRVSIKHKIRLKKVSLPQEKAVEKPIIPPIIEEKKEIIVPKIAEQILPSAKEEVLSPIEKEINIILPIVKKEPILPLAEDITAVFTPAKEEILDKTTKDPLDISQLFEEAKEKNKQLEAFLNDNTPQEPIIVEKKPIIPPLFENPLSEKELYSVSDALKEILAGEKKVNDFLEEKQEVKVPISQEKKEIPIIISPEKTELFTPPKVEIPDFSPIGIEKVPHNVADKQHKVPVAWLIRHTENRKPVYYELFEGDNTIGRGDNATPVEVDISDDKYVSRGHAWIRAFRVPGNIYIFELRDDGAKRKDNSPSMNGTYLNASMRRIDANVAMYLQDGDTIQVGMTKLVFKVKPQAATNQNQLFEEVLKSDYTITVIF